MRPGAARSLALAIAIAATGAGAISLAPISEGAGCGGVDGVTVVVENGMTAGTSIDCATGDPATGLDALRASGHAYTFMSRQPGFVCTIDAKPDPCNDGPANAYWSYWHAQPGGSWSYGTTGAGSYNPVPGSIEGWSFGGGKPPSSRPPAAMSATTSGTTTSGTTTSGSTTAPGLQRPASAAGDLVPDGRAGLGGLALGVALVTLLLAMAGRLAWRRRHAND